MGFAVIYRLSRVLRRWLIARRFLPKSTMGKAVSYALTQWKSLEVYLQVPKIKIDNKFRTVHNSCYGKPSIKSKIGFFLVMPGLANAALSFTPLSKVAGATVLSPTLTSTTF
jgi:Transposase IS66 family